MRKELIERVFKFETLKHRCTQEQTSIRLYQKISLIVAKKMKVMSLDDRRFVDAIAIYHVITSKEIDTKYAWSLYKKIKNQLNEYQRLIVLSHFVQRHDYKLSHKKEITEEFYSIDLDGLKNSGSYIKNLFVHSNLEAIENFISQT
ncbi:hypothetical protein [Pseudomonas sp. EpS/L25]|uniref:hypothetical protein n=1 Tax=Pseudomonas sp. EpS/L25 TaxID=1749078 RepID=UPI000AC9393F|nr:hypothetical protein [Pseudomonas sp. EpS/L25]